MDDTTVIQMTPYITDKVKHLAMHGKTMIMMYRVTGEIKYLDRANADYQRAKSLLRSGFERPLGVHLEIA